IIDLRGNSGGGSTVGPVLETFFFDKYTELLEFKERNGKTEMSSTVSWLLEKRYLKPLYLLVDKGTASAAEAFAYALKHQNRCVIVGEPTSGGAYMNAYFPVNEEFIVAISTAAPFLPGTTESWEGKGVQPHYEVEKEKALTKAINLIKAQ
ncbi:MAG: S41 family peptidase, partial [Bacteroidota bacterium]